MSFSKCPGTDAVCYTKPLDSLKGWNDHFFWVDTFACLALFSWHTGKSVSRDGVPKSSKFKAKHHATLVVYPGPFHKYPKPFLCLIGMSQMDLLSFIRTADPTKVRVGERECDEASVDNLFDEGGSGEQADQGDSTGGGHGTKVVDAGEPLHPAKKLRGDYGAPGVPAIGGKSQSAVHHLLTEAVQHAEVRGGAMPTLPFASSSVSTTPEREGGDYTELIAGANP
nr:hypothetical protein [Tanacetum cinerariifolium]